ncbi:MAG TPA: hypothetical protein IAB63_08510 [Candidatus Onthocola gallistercoris]|uniref:Uncharacterized protein n=1 Tax=Candidatus Onthocola gallistercoris TaxID=2840876 RepID=A0A9D1HHF8_9FIRM|nr:hypothetical protein [Candidatus Onthocola gallistercoris]
MEADRNFVDESTLRFIFDKCVNVVKFDETAFYRNRFNGFPGAKGVDIIAESDESIQLIEIKDCLGYETENIWRTSVDNSKLKSAPSGLPADSSFDIEVVQKVMATIACLYGAWSKSERMQQSVVLSDFWKAFTNDKITKDKKKLRIVLFLEGDFYANGPKSRNKKMIMKRLQDSIKGHLSWLNCQVAVEDSNTYAKQFFTVKRLAVPRQTKK